MSMKKLLIKIFDERGEIYFDDLDQCIFQYLYDQLEDVLTEDHEIKGPRLDFNEMDQILTFSPIKWLEKIEEALKDLFEDNDLKISFYIQTLGESKT